MKNLIAGVLALYVGLGPALAQNDREIFYHNSVTRRNAIEDFAGDCGVAERDAFQMEKGKPAGFTVTIYRTGWSGKCINGVAEGVGKLSIKFKYSDGKVVFRPVERVDEGLMVRGRKIGPWKNIFYATAGLDGKVEGKPTFDLYYWEDSLDPGLYLRNSDGSFIQAAYSPSAVFAAKKGATPIPGTVVSQHLEEALEASASAKITKSRSDIRSPILDDLMPGGVAKWSFGPPLRDTRDKTVALMFSRRTYQSFKSMDDFASQMASYAARAQDSRVQIGLKKLAEISKPRTLVRLVARSLRRNFKTVTALPDLTAIASSRADCVVIVDFHFIHDAVGLFKIYDRILDGVDVQPGSFPTKVSTSFSYLILDRNLNIEGVPLPLDLPTPLHIDAFGKERSILKSVDDNLLSMDQYFPSQKDAIPDFLLELRYRFHRE